jgi:ribonuclease P protein component
MIRWITLHREYSEFSHASRACRTENFYVPVLETNAELAVGITISGKVSKAVWRNRLKRRIRAWFREHYTELPQGYKMNIIARKGSAELTWQELGTQLHSIMEQLA